MICLPKKTERSLRAGASPGAFAFSAVPFPVGFHVLRWPSSTVPQEVEHLEPLPQNHHLHPELQGRWPTVPHFLGVCLSMKLMGIFHLIFKAGLNAYIELLLLISDIMFFSRKIIPVRWRNSLSALCSWSEADQRGLINYSLWHFTSYFTFYNYQSLYN